MVLTTFHYSSDPPSSFNTNSSPTSSSFGPSVSVATSTHNQFHQALPLDKLPFDVNDYLNFELNEDFINTNGLFMNNYATLSSLVQGALTGNISDTKSDPTLSIYYNEEEDDEEDEEGDDEGCVELDEKEELDFFEDRLTGLSTASTSATGSLSSGGEMKKSRSVSMDVMNEQKDISIKEEGHSKIPEDIEIDLNFHFNIDKLLGEYESTSNELKTSFYSDETVVGQETGFSELSFENIQSLLNDVGISMIEPRAEKEDDDVSYLNINLEKEDILIPNLDVNLVDFRCNCFTKYQKLCKNSILCFKHSLEEKSKIPRFDPDINRVIKIYKVVQEQHAIELKKTYKLDKKAEKNQKKQEILLIKAKLAVSKVLKKQNSQVLSKKKSLLLMSSLVKQNDVDMKFAASLTTKLKELPQNLDVRLKDFNHRLHLNNLILSQAFNQYE